MEEEIWRPVKGYEEIYEVSNLGRIRSLNYRHTGRTELLKPAMNTKGYLCVCLYKDGEHKIYKLHRLVAQAFLSNPENLPEVNHIDENKTNNCVDNLEWCSSKYNSNHGTRNARISKPVQQLSKDGRLIAVWTSTIEAWRQTGINESHICGCCNGKRRSAGGYVWHYTE